MTEYVAKKTPIHVLPAGSPFLLWSGQRGLVVEHGRGATLVQLEHQTTTTFTPLTGRNAGKEVTIERRSERTTISLHTEVEPC